MVASLLARRQVQWPPAVGNLVASVGDKSAPSDFAWWVEQSVVVLSPSVRAQLQVSWVGTINEQPVVAQPVLTRPPVDCRNVGSACVDASLVRTIRTLSTAAVSFSTTLEPGMLTQSGNNAKQSEIRVTRESTMYTMWQR